MTMSLSNYQLLHILQVEEVVPSIGGSRTFNWRKSYLQLPMFHQVIVNEGEALMKYRLVEIESDQSNLIVSVESEIKHKILDKIFKKCKEEDYRGFHHVISYI